MKKIKIRAGQLEMEAELNESSVAQKVWKILPIKAQTNTWGEEIYFEIPLKTELENPQEEVKEGDLGYWPPGRAFCIFFGLTPASSPGHIRPASEVEVIGKVLGNPKKFGQVSSGESVFIEKQT
ncbi:MAG TPA: cyclophilin-like fold protein [Nevskiaceae bacterium]|nr:cyclophilin-like fold protein [Nevskiaceae bacterium]